MARTVCKICGSNKVEWLKDGQRWRLYNYETGTFHEQQNGSCVPDPKYQEEHKNKEKIRIAARKDYLKKNPWARNEQDERDGL